MSEKLKTHLSHDGADVTHWSQAFMSVDFTQAQINDKQR